jgi:hypothetical protein
MDTSDVPWRASSREEVQEFYHNEFRSYLDELPPWITEDGPKGFGLAFRRRYPTKSGGNRNFIRRSSRVSGSGSPPQFDSLSEWADFVADPAGNDPLDNADPTLVDPMLVDQDRPVSEAVYYRLDQWERPWILGVDIDAKDIAYNRAKREAGAEAPTEKAALLDAVGVSQQPPAGYPYAFEDIDRAIEYGFETAEILRSKLNYRDVEVVYSGQGVHVYGLDDDPDHAYDTSARNLIADLLQEVHEIPIDRPVTTDDQRVIRVVRSLHAGVSRLVTPIGSPEFDPRTDPRAIPDFIDNGD